VVLTITGRVLGVLLALGFMVVGVSLTITFGGAAAGYSSCHPRAIVDDAEHILSVRNCASGEPNPSLEIRRKQS